MRRAIPLLVLLLALVATDVPAGGATLRSTPLRQLATDAPPSAPARLIVRFRPAAGPADRAGARDAVDAVSTRRLDLARTELVRLPRGRSVATAVRRLRARRDVEFAQPDYAYRPESIPDDPLFDQQWGLNNVGQAGLLFSPGTPDADIDAPEAWDLTTGSASVRVAVVDTGVNSVHPDLQANVDAADGFDFVSNNTTTADDVAGHGTVVASVIGARGDNGIGITGVAQRVTILPLQVADASGALATSHIVDAIGYARDHGARVVNMSFGRYGVAEDPALVDAIDASPNILFSASAGNFNAQNQPNDNDVAPHWPSNLTLTRDNVIAAANTDNTDVLDSTSSFGNTSVDLAAPGTDIAGAAGEENEFTENFDGVTAPDLPAGWTATGTWATSTEESPLPSGPNSLTDSPGGPYANSSDTTATSPTFTVPADGTCVVTNTRKRDTELNKDYFITEVSLDGGAFTEIETRSGDTADAFRIGSPDFQTGSATQAAIRFRLTSDVTNNFDGVHIDDVSVDCAPASGGYVSGTGTSFSSPMVSGAAGLLLSRDPTLTAAQLKSTLRATVDPLASLNGKVATRGRLNVARAVRSLVAPDATAAAADGVSATSAVLHGSANPQGSPAQAHFEYRPAGSAIWTSVGATALAEGAAPVALSTTLGGLVPDTTYEFRLLATKPLRSGTSQSLSFRTAVAGMTGPTGPLTPVDITAPHVRGLVVAPSAFLPLRAGATIAKTRRGARVRFRLDEAAKVILRVMASRTGRVSRGRCVKPTRANRQARKCRTYVTIKTLSLRGTLNGAVNRRFSGRIGRRALRPGRYRVQVTATDAAGNRSRPANANFRIAKR